MEHLWNSYYVQMRITYREHSRGGKVKTYTDMFECDQHIAEAIRLFNEKGYATGNCCEGYPYRITKIRRISRAVIFRFVVLRIRSLCWKN